MTLMRHFGLAIFLLFALLILPRVQPAFGADGILSMNSAQSGESYAVPNFVELSHTLIMMGGLDIKDPKVIDEYAKMTYCTLYKQKFTDDFAWNSIRQQIITNIQDKKEHFRVLYQISGVVYLGRYNFDTQDFPFVNNSAFINVGVLTIFDERHSRPPLLCDKPNTSDIFPYSYSFRLKQPLTFDRFKLPMNQAEKLLDRMQATKNTDRKLYVRFRLHVQSVNMRTNYNKSIGSTLQGDLLSIDLFLDKNMTEPLAHIPLN